MEAGVSLVGKAKGKTAMENEEEASSDKSAIGR